MYVPEVNTRTKMRHAWERVAIFMKFRNAFYHVDLLVYIAIAHIFKNLKLINARFEDVDFYQLSINFCYD